MSRTVISVEELSKCYRLGTIGTGTFYGDVGRWWAKQRGRPDPYRKIGDRHRATRDGDTLWALKDVSFTIEEGQAVGIIGRNGAGKSTLLKILSRVTAPTSGVVRARGRLASLLEVGTGFHPELTGRENIYLNGAILGMRKAEIGRKLEDIVAFSGVERFIDTPVKRYSSGMYVRLAFAVAAHLEPEILVVDEVLAVGDAEFQKRCLGKMRDVASAGRTILFVSHNMQAIRQLCTETIWFDHGGIRQRGTTPDVVEQYIRDSSIVVSSGPIEEFISGLPPDPVFRLRGIRLLQGTQCVTRTVLSGKRLDIEVSYTVLEATTGLRVYFDLLDEDFDLLFRSFHDDDDDDLDGTAVFLPGDYTSRATIPRNTLAPREYYIRVSAGIFNIRAVLPVDGLLIPITVAHTGDYNRSYASDVIRGRLAPVLAWSTQRD